MQASYTFCKHHMHTCKEPADSSSADLSAGAVLQAMDMQMMSMLTSRMDGMKMKRTHTTLFPSSSIRRMSRMQMGKCLCMLQASQRMNCSSAESWRAQKRYAFKEVAEAACSMHLVQDSQTSKMNISERPSLRIGESK